MSATTARTVYYTGAFRFPDGDAAAARVLGIGKALRAAGARVVYAGWEAAGRQEDARPDGSHQFDGFTYVSQDDLRHLRASSVPARQLGQLLTGRNTLRWLLGQPVKRGDVVIAYHGSTYFLWCLRRLCATRQLKLVLDCTEWRAPRQVPRGWLNPGWWDSEFATRFLMPRIGRVIVISSYLERHFSSKSCAVIRVPPLVDAFDPKWRAGEGSDVRQGPLRLAYAGTPGRKDLVREVLIGLHKLRDLPITLELIGPTRESLLRTDPRVGEWLDRLGDTVVMGGPVAQSDVPARLRRADFTVLLRPNARYAKAGFPTKVVESLAAGVPVVANRVGDLPEYIEDGQEGLLLDHGSVESFESGIRRLFAMERPEWSRMRAVAMRRAATSFDYRRHVSKLADFLQ